MKKPNTFEIQKIGNPNLGFISVLENPQMIPFEIKRVYWTYFTPNSIERGGHAHRELEQVIVAVSGRIKFLVEELDGEKKNIELIHPNQCLYLPPFTWRTIQFEHNSVLLCMASQLYDPEDYIRDYTEFESLKEDFIRTI